MTTLAQQLSHQGYNEPRPRVVSTMSFTSNRSRRSSGSGHKLELTESAKEKKRLNTKADPSKALNEAQPAAVALEQSNLEDLRLTRHKDSDGNVITDPDRSNPTRYRLERPLDTIRSFNAAAEGTSSRRSSSYYNSRPASNVGTDGGQNRRSSYYGPGYSPQRRGPGPAAGGYYKNTSYGFGPQSSVEETPGSSQQFGRPLRSPGNPYYGPNGESPATPHSHQQSYETMTSGSDENSKSTNPSSQNSSFDRLHQLRKPDDNGYENPYANEINFGSGHPNQPYTSYEGTNGGYGQQMLAGPPPPPKQYAPNNPRQPIKLNGTSSDASAMMTDLKKSQSAKRQSWIKRRFSRRDS